MIPKLLFVLLAGVSPPVSADASRDTAAAAPPGRLGDEEMREELAQVVADRDLELPQAIANAEADAGGTAVAARVALRDSGDAVYEVDVFAANRVHEVEVDLESLLVRSRTVIDIDVEDDDDAALARGADWAALLTVAEAAGRGTALGIEAEGDSGTFVVDSLVGSSGWWEVVLRPDATVVRSEGRGEPAPVS